MGKKNFRQDKKMKFHGDFKSKFKTSDNLEKSNIGDINFDMIRERVVVDGSVQKIVQTGGPTIFIVSDGTGVLALKGFDKPGERAYPEIKVGDFIKANIEISEYEGELEGEIKSIVKLSEDEKKILAKKFEEIQMDRARLESPDFLIDSPILDKLKSLF